MAIFFAVSGENQAALPPVAQQAAALPQPVQAVEQAVQAPAVAAPVQEERADAEEPVVAPAKAGESTVVDEAPPLPPCDVVAGKVKSGATASSILSSCLTPARIHELAGVCKELFPLTSLRAGQPYSLSTRDGEFVAFDYKINDDERLVVELNDKEFRAKTVPIIYDLKTRVVRGVITDNFFNAVRRAGEQPELAVRLADMFAWDVDFARDVRVGDSFTVVVEKRFLEDEDKGYGRILAAEFVNDDHIHRGYLFADAEGRESHYHENGKSLRKEFLKAPLAFTRISSNYSMRRKHPVTHKVRAHPAIDYAAPVGTPVRSVGDGTVAYVGRKGDAGRMVTVRHGSVYQTSYLHLRGYARGIRTGAKIRQGQVIGYVGSSGLATGPHLDFRMKKFGSYVNPLRVTTPSADSVGKDDMAKFTAEVDRFKGLLESEGHLRADSIPTKNAAAPGEISQDRGAI